MVKAVAASYSSLFVVTSLGQLHNITMSDISQDQAIVSFIISLDVYITHMNVKECFSGFILTVFFSPLSFLGALLE